MRSRARVAFRPGVAGPGGPDRLECRRLLSAGVEAGTARMASDAAAKDASRTDAGAAVSPATTATAADPSSESSISDSAWLPAPGAPSPAANVGSTDSARPVDHAEAAAIPVSTSGTSNGTMAPSTLDMAERMSDDEATTRPTADSSAPDRSALGVVASPGGTAGRPNPDASPALTSSAAAGIATGAGTTGHAAADGPEASALGADGSLLADAAPAADLGPAATVPGTTYHNSEGPGGDVVHEDHDGATAAEAGSTAATSSAAEPSPRCADLLTEFLPFKRAALDQAIDRFLSPLEDLGAELAAWQPPSGLIPAMAIIAGAALAAEVARRRAGGGGDAPAVAATGQSGDELVRFPGDPWVWSIRNS